MGDSVLRIRVVTMLLPALVALGCRIEGLPPDPQKDSLDGGAAGAAGADTLATRGGGAGGPDASPLGGASAGGESAVHRPGDEGGSGAKATGGSGEAGQDATGVGGTHTGGSTGSARTGGTGQIGGEGGQGASATGGAAADGGSVGTGGTDGAGSGGAATGGRSMGGSAGSGGTATGGQGGAGSSGLPTGGSSGAPTGGSGGTPTGGSSGAPTGGSGGTPTGGSGGASTGGSGGAASGGGSAVECSATMPTGGTPYCASYGSGTVAGLQWSLWSNGSGGCVTTYSTAALGVSWNDSGDLLARIGLEWGSAGKPYDQYGPITAQFAHSKTGSSDGYSYIGAYGWSTNPCVEYYIVEDSYDTMPVDPGSTTNKGTADIDGGTYTLYTRNMNGTGGSACPGLSTWVQFFSIRHTARRCGQISISEHFKAWEGKGMSLGNLLEAKVFVEVWGGTGSLDFAVANVMVQ
ncbi:MAG: glycoside hydrolase family 11 protein [Polyangiaceae bacterium]|nr:glycoside hydrolase family 11 protein [Polyangiaceae bacterium]